MSRWNRIPNEILTQIIDYNGPNSDYIYKSGWQSVNRQWYEIFISKKYRSILIELDVRNHIVYNILNSSFNPGLWVHDIIITDINVPKSLNLYYDVLSWLMYYCPCVRKVHVNSSSGSVWYYFYRLLQYNGYWKRLETLSQYRDSDDPNTSIHYTNSLFFLTKSLRHLSLSCGMIKPARCQRLSEFTRVEVLEIEEGTVSDLYDCCDMISLLPKLQKVFVVLYPLSLAKLPNPERTHNQEIVKSGGFTNIDSLSLENFVPKNKQDFLFLMNHSRI